MKKKLNYFYFTAVALTTICTAPVFAKEKASSTDSELCREIRDLYDSLKQVADANGWLSCDLMYRFQSEVWWLCVQGSDATPQQIEKFRKDAIDLYECR